MLQFNFFGALRLRGALVGLFMVSGIAGLAAQDGLPPTLRLTCKGSFWFTSSLDKERKTTDWTRKFELRENVLRRLDDGSDEIGNCKLSMGIEIDCSIDETYTDSKGSNSTRVRRMLSIARETGRFFDLTIYERFKRGSITPYEQGDTLRTGYCQPFDMNPLF